MVFLLEKSVIVGENIELFLGKYSIILGRKQSVIVGGKLKGCCCENGSVIVGENVFLYFTNNTICPKNNTIQFPSNTLFFSNNNNNIVLSYQ